MARLAELIEDESVETSTNSFEMPVDAGFDGDSVDLRSELAAYSAEIGFPAKKSDLVDTLQEQFAPERIVELIDRLEPNREYANAQEVWLAVDGDEEERL